MAILVTFGSRAVQHSADRAQMSCRSGSGANDFGGRRGRGPRRRCESGLRTASETHSQHQKVAAAWRARTDQRAPGKPSHAPPGCHEAPMPVGPMGHHGSCQPRRDFARFASRVIVSIFGLRNETRCVRTCGFADDLRSGDCRIVRGSRQLHDRNERRRCEYQAPRAITHTHVTLPDVKRKHSTGCLRQHFRCQ
jgi:hypothetical protein